MKLLIDTNNVFSALLKKDNIIFHIIKVWPDDIYLCQFSVIELFKHKEKILKFSEYNEEELLVAYYELLKMVKIFHDDEILEKNRDFAYKLCHDIDPKDSVFVAASHTLGIPLWSGDIKLQKGLKKKGYTKILDTKEVVKLLSKK